MVVKTIGMFGAQNRWEKEETKSDQVCNCESEL